MTPAEVDEGGSITACAVYSGLEAPTRLLLRTVGAASANPAERYGKVKFSLVPRPLPLREKEGAGYEAKSSYMSK